MLAIRLVRFGARHRPYYRIVVSENEKRLGGSFVESIGYYHPITKDKDTRIDKDRAEYWLSKGARPSKSVGALFKKHQIGV